MPEAGDDRTTRTTIEAWARTQADLRAIDIYEDLADSVEVVDVHGRNGEIIHRVYHRNGMSRLVQAGLGEPWAEKKADRSRGIPRFLIPPTGCAPMIDFKDEGGDRTYRHVQFQTYLRLNPDERWPAATEWTAEDWNRSRTVNFKANLLRLGRLLSI